MRSLLKTVPKSQPQDLIQHRYLPGDIFIYEEKADYSKKNTSNNCAYLILSAYIPKEYNIFNVLQSIPGIQKYTIEYVLILTKIIPFFCYFTKHCL